MALTRERRIEIIRRRLLRRSMPRFQVSLILLFTGLAGFLTSFSLLHLGVSRMWLRYPIAILIAYGVFLLLLRLWLWLQRRELEVDIDADPSDLDFISSGAPGDGESFRFGGGGDLGGGGGAGGSWGESVSSTSASGGVSVADGAGFDLDLEEGWLVVLAIVALVGGLAASVYIIYIAPALLAEILVDGALVAGLYKRVKRIGQRHWLRAAVSRTLLPAVLAAIFFTAAGYAMQKAVPAAHSIGEVWNQLAGS